jgi:hypothetical protein
MKNLIKFLKSSKLFYQLGFYCYKTLAHKDTGKGYFAILQRTFPMYNKFKKTSKETLNNYNSDADILLK